ncbi:Protein dispatched [Diplonema papillatum]|nr:Protein dispatched [Diplonema papillatum]
MPAVFDVAALVYTKRPGLCLFGMLALCVLLTWQLAVEASHPNGLTFDAEVDSFVVRGTALSDRHQTVLRFPHKLGLTKSPGIEPPETLPPGTASPAPETAAPEVKPTEAPPTPSPHQRCKVPRETELHVLVALEEGGNVLSNDGMRRICEFVHAIEESSAWAHGCYGELIEVDRDDARNETAARPSRPSEDCDGEALRCDTVAWVGNFPELLSAMSGNAAAVRLLRAVQAIDPLRLLGGSVLLKETCNATGTVPCDLRDELGCSPPAAKDKPACSEPCLIKNLDLCALLLLTDARPSDVLALQSFPLPEPAAAGESSAGLDAGACGAKFTDAYSVRVKEAVRVLASWSERSQELAEALPASGGRPFLDKYSISSAAGPLRTSYTRVVLRVAKHGNRDVAGVESLVPPLLSAAKAAGLDVSFREWTFFEEQLHEQLLRDAVFAGGSVAFVLLFVVAYCRSLFLAAGAVAGVLLCLPLAASFYVHVLGIRWFGILHSIGLFLVAGVGADDFFVLLALWQEAKRDRGLRTEREQLAWTLERGFRTVAATSLTTAAAFLGNCVSHIPAIRLFGLFMAVLLLALLLSVFLWLAPLLILADRFSACMSRAFPRLFPGDDTLEQAQPGGDPHDFDGDELSLIAAETDGAEPGVGPGMSTPESPAFSAPHGFEDVDFISDLEETYLSSKAGSLSPNLTPRTFPIPHRPIRRAGSAKCVGIANPHPADQHPQPGKDKAGGSSPGKEKDPKRWSCGACGGLFVAAATESPRRTAAACAAVLCFFGLAAVLRVSGADGQLSLWPAGHNQARYMQTELEMNTDVGRADLRLLWGVVPQDTASPLNPAEKTDVQFAQGFNATTHAAQEYFLKVCRQLSGRAGGAAPELMPGVPLHRAVRGTVSCTILDLADWLLETKNMTLPLPSDQFKTEMIRFHRAVGLTGGFSGYYYNRTGSFVLRDPVAMAIWVGTTVNWQRPHQEVEPLWKMWETWLKLSDPPPEVAPGFHSAGGAWVLMETQVEMERTAWASLLISLLLAFVILTITTRSVRLSVVAVACLSGVVIVSAGCLGLFGWSLGVIESICATIVVGMSCDYVVHMAACHADALTALPSSSPKARLQYVLRLIAPPIAASAATSIGAAAFLLNCEVLFLFKFGAFVVVTLTAALAAALILYPALILLFTRETEVDVCGVSACCFPTTASRSTGFAAVDPDSDDAIDDLSDFHNEPADTTDCG